MDTKGPQHIPAQDTSPALQLAKADSTYFTWLLGVSRVSLPCRPFCGAWFLGFLPPLGRACEVLGPTYVSRTGWRLSPCIFLFSRPHCAGLTGNCRTGSLHIGNDPIITHVSPKRTLRAGFGPEMLATDPMNPPCAWGFARVSFLLPFFGGSFPGVFGVPVSLGLAPLCHSA